MRIPSDAPKKELHKSSEGTHSPHVSLASPTRYTQYLFHLAANMAARTS